MAQTTNTVHAQGAHTIKTARFRTASRPQTSIHVAEQRVTRKWRFCVLRKYKTARPNEHRFTKIAGHLAQPCMPQWRASFRFHSDRVLHRFL
jgi:hypothetical protein